MPTTAARDRAVARGVAINGLVILGNEPGLFRYYRENVIGGAAAFVMTADSFETFAGAIVVKLIREITDAPALASAPPRAIGPSRARFEEPLVSLAKGSTGYFIAVSRSPGSAAK